MIPGLGARGENVHRWLIKRRIVQASRLQADNIWEPFPFERELTAACLAEASFTPLAILTDDLVVPGLTGELKFELGDS
jgi:hypothetical protein